METTSRRTCPGDPAPVSLLHIDSMRRILRATGFGTDPAIQSLVSDATWLKSIRKSRIASLGLNGRKLLLIWADVDDGGVLMVREAPGDTVFDFIAAVDFAYDIFDHLLSNPYDAMTVVDESATLRFVSPIHEKFFNLEHGESSGKPVEKVIENTRLHRIVQTGKAEIGHVQRMGGTNRVVSRTPIHRDGRIVGAIGRVMFKGPEDIDKLNRRIKSLESEVEFYKREADAMRRQDFGIDSMIGSSQRIQDLKRDIIRVAPLDVPVLIMGESGSGKELVAQALHRLSSRRTRNMVMINATALPSTLVESELFGYSAGAFTGAQQRGHVGKFEQANNSSLFLDEIGDMPTEVQAKLLRVLQDGYVEKLGSAKPVKVDFRLISATNRDIETMISRSEFRLDLFYRISPVVLRVPPLRERLEDITALADEFLRAFADRHGRPRLRLMDDAVTYLKAQAWPGNVRQLKHEIERAAIFANEERIGLDALRNPVGSTLTFASSSASTPISTDGDGSRLLRDQLQHVEERLIENAMGRHRGNKKKVAEELGISRSYLYKKLGEMNFFDTDVADEDADLGS
ncbi:MAG TPA: sigma 54-interacting transcriptional regulator [Tianweitania sediminis]|nr:sigma 54-interacting transcriptional regulator [Tianweitania sediminis]